MGDSREPLHPAVQRHGKTESLNPGRSLTRHQIADTLISDLSLQSCEK